MKKSQWQKGNEALRARQYDDAVVYFESALASAYEELRPRIEFNLNLALRLGGRRAFNLPSLIIRPDGLENYFFELILASKLFDSEWYIKNYREKYGYFENPLEHYIKYGVYLKTNPSPLFDTSYYLEIHRDVAAAGIHPFLHYVSQGIKEGRSCQRPPVNEFDLDRYTVEEHRYVTRLPMGAPVVEKAARVIAFYLPQFHPIPENDVWWAKGFTEWTNVKPAKPQFAGHYQPHVPDASLGYYDLRDAAVMRKQIELAKQYGVEGFCFYTYWFTGHRLLETPVDNYLSDASLDLPFCICWANENWSRRWDGLDQELLMEQHYSPEDDLAFIAHMSKYLCDPRYIRVEGKPLLVVYRPNLFPSMKSTAQRWRDWCRNNGIGEIYIAYVQSFEKLDPEEYGLDAAIEFPPNNSAPPDITDKSPALSTEFTGKVYDWRIFLKRTENFEAPTYTLFRGACPSWDNTARKKERGTVFAHSSPKQFERWLVSTFEETRSRIQEPEQRLIFINAWNEWAEGAHLEPDQRYGYAWLQAVRDAHSAALQTQRRIVVVSHDAHPHGAQYLILEVARLLKNIGFEVNILLLDGGKLLPDFEIIGRVVNAKLVAETTIRNFLEKYRALGASEAITSTVVSGAAVPLLKASGYRIISLIHELPGVIQQMKQEKNARTIADLSDKLVFPAELVHQRFAEIVPMDAAKVVIRPQGVLRSNPYKNRKEAARRIIFDKHSLSADTRIVLNIAYADARKGADLFVEIAALTLKVRSNTVFIWVGHAEQTLQSKIEARISELGLEGRLLFTGFDKEPMAYYAAADVFALTSREDPFPNVVLEAAEVGVPVIAFAGASGAGDLIVEQGGRLAPAFDLDAYSRSLCEILTQPALIGRPPVGSLRSYVLDLLNTLNGLQRVSVVVPNYNYEQHIRARLDSVCQQSHPIYELIVLDDQSSDDSVQVIEAYLDTLTCDRRLVVNEKNSGSVFRQWARGVQSSHGDLVWIAEADDLCAVNMLAALVPAFDDPEVVLAYCQSQQIDEHGTVLAENYLEYTEDVSKKWASDHLSDGLEEIGHALSIKNTIPNVSAVVFRRTALLSALKTIGDRLFDYRVAGDWLVYIHVLRQGKVYYCNRSLNKHRRHSVSVTKATAVRSHLQEVLEMQQTARALANSPPAVVDKAQAYAERLAQQFGLS
jgi:glycosyltransferase involved in cell wall biosynthesis